MKTIRTAYLLDIDNLCGAPMASDAQVRQVLDTFTSQYQPGKQDQVYCAATAKAAYAVKFQRPGFTVHVGRGKDGSDLRLLDIGDPQWLKQRFDRVVIGSGDGIFGPLVQTLTELGIQVEVICGHGAMSRSFGEIAACCQNSESLRLGRLNFAVAA
jgi:hypothetical protein